MKAPMKWLREYVDIDLNTEEYASRMVMTGTAVEGIENTGNGFDHVVVGRVETCEMHPDSDHLHVLSVDTGADEKLQIVCGAPNVAAGQLVAVALAGAHLPGGVKIKAGKLRGVLSQGMCCSGPELGIPEGLYPHVGDKGILVFQEEYPLGTDVKEIFGLGDDIVDFEILANRPDCLSIWGLARESAAVLDTHFVMPEIEVEEKGDKSIEDLATIRVMDDELCPRYCTRAVRNVKIGPSPKWMREYLYGAGVRPINNIVDITNFVMLETGHPMHAFNLDKVRGNTIVVRRANPNEKLTTLDGKEYELNENMLVIVDAENATGLAGIMGGEESEIEEDTKTVLFECAAFDRTNIRITGRTLGIHTEASGRFERGVCRDTALQAINRACMLVNMLECGDVAPGVFDYYPHPQQQRVIEAEISRINRRISAALTGEEMEDILNRLYIETDLFEDGHISCTIPAWREDMEGEADLSEEVLRLHGYEKIPSTLMSGVTMSGKRSQQQILQDRVKGALVGQGFFEAVTFSFISPKWIESLELPGDDRRLRPVVLRNPLGEDTSVMRTSLVPSMLNTLSVNINRSNAEGKLFELAPVFYPLGPGELPAEKKMLALGIYGEKTDFFTLKDEVASMLYGFGIRITCERGGDDYYHPGRKAILKCGDVVLGQMGEIHPDTAARFEMEGRRIYLAEIELEAIEKASRPIPPVSPLPRFPAVTRDLALVMNDKTGIGDVMETIRQSAGKELEELHLFDVYKGPQVGLGRMSAAFALTFRAADRTLTDPEINRHIEKILKACEERFGASIRA